MQHTSVIDYLEDAARSYPDKVAYVDDDRSLTFGETSAYADRIASELLRAEAELDGGAARASHAEPVIVLTGRNVEAIAAFLGIARAGKYYVPIDVEMPLARMDKIIETLGCRLAVCAHGHEELLAGSRFDGRVLDVERCRACAPDAGLLAHARASLIDTDPLYVLFTSGSTGMPKGVILRHLSVIDYIERLVEVFGFSSRDVFANQAPFFFDNSVLDIYTTLKVGATMVIVDTKLFSYPVRLLECLEEHKVTTIFWVPSALIIVANLRALRSRHVSSLDKVLFAGEVMPNKQLNMWRKAYPDALFANLYGPTEIAVDCTYYVVDRAFGDADPLPIGIPFKNSDVLVLAEGDRYVPPTEADVMGELCVRGSSLAAGYFSDPERTDQVFTQNPLNPCWHEYIYRTGDLVHYNERGELMYDSRKDFQIKRFGHRIELGEIEGAALDLEGVSQGCCVYDGDRNALVLFYVGKADADALQADLATRLPDYMLPTRCARLRALPLTPNGKIDRKELLEQAREAR